MAIANGIVLEVRTAGSDTLNGGGFNPTSGGTDRSQQDGNFVNIDGAAITATVQATTTDIVLVGYVVAAGDVGNLVNISGGTMTAGVYEIKSLPGGNAWRLDRSGGTAGQTGTGGMGGAFASPGMASKTVSGVGSPVVWIKSGTYAITSTSTTTAGGCVATSSGMWEGYQTTRGDRAARPLLQASGIATATLFTLDSNSCFAACIAVDGASLTSIRGFRGGGTCAILNCTAANCTNDGFNTVTSSTSLAFCAATGCSGAGKYAFRMGGGTVLYIESCVAYANTCTGFYVDNMAAYNCLAISNTGATTDGFDTTAGSVLSNCTAYGNGRDGFANTGNSSNIRYHNCVSESNGRYGFNGGAGTIRLMRVNCATFNNTTSAYGGSTMQYIQGDITGTTTFFTDAPGGNFTPNAVATGGALLRALAYANPYNGPSTVTYRDVGAAQHIDGSGGGGGGQQAMVDLGSKFGFS